MIKLRIKPLHYIKTLKILKLNIVYSSNTVPPHLTQNMSNQQYWEI